MAKILLNHPSRGRPTQVVVAFEDFVTKSSGLHPITYVISVDANDPTLAAYSDSINQCMKLAETYKHVTVRFLVNNNKTVTEAVNRSYTPENLDSFDILALVSDDFRMPDQWDIAIFKEFEQFGYDKIIKTFQPGGRTDLITIQIAGHQFWKDYGTFFWHEYPSVFSDDDMTQWARLNNRVIDAPHIVMRHLHPGCNQPDSFKHDATYEHENKPINYQIGERIFLARKARGFRG